MLRALVFQFSMSPVRNSLPPPSLALGRCLREKFLDARGLHRGKVLAVESIKELRSQLAVKDAG